MSNEQSGTGAGSHSEADLAQAFKELQRGEQTAAALESHLDSIEKKIEALLAQAEKAEKELKETSGATEKSSSTEEKDSL
jgi:Skp family chaperone for outer membrane proteins